MFMNVYECELFKVLSCSLIAVFDREKKRNSRTNGPYHLYVLIMLNINCIINVKEMCFMF